jgi:hypothetical protein
MIKPLVLGSVLGAVVLFLWSTLAWTLIPWPGQPLRSFTNEDAMQQAVIANAPKSGNYLLPNAGTKGLTSEQQQKAMDKVMRGPFIFAAVRLEPLGSMTKYLIVEFLTQFVCALIATLLLLQTSSLSYLGRVGFLTAIGVVIFVGGHIQEWNWWAFSNAYTVMELGAIVIGWVLASLIMSAVVRGKTIA